MLLIEMQNIFTAQYKVVITTDFVICIIAPPLPKNKKVCTCWMNSKLQIPNCTSTSFTNIIYNKSTTFTSRKIHLLRINMHY